MLDTVPHRELSLLRSVMLAEETEVAPAATYTSAMPSSYTLVSR